MNLIPKNFFYSDFDKLFLTSDEENNMLCDIYEEDNNYYIEMDIPGFDKKDINIEIKNNYLTVLASKEEEKEHENRKYIKRERSNKKYKRTFSLNEVEEEKIEAKFENGMLFITIPKMDEEKLKRKVSIK